MISYTNRCPLSTCHWVRVCLWCLQMAQTAAETMIDADNPLWAPGCLRYKANAPPVRSTRPANIQRLDKTPLTAGTYLPTLHSNHPHPPTLCHLLLKRWIFRYCTIISCMLPLSFSLHLFFDAWYNFFMGGVSLNTIIVKFWDGLDMLVLRMAPRCDITTRKVVF